MVSGGGQSCAHKNIKAQELKMTKCVVRKIDLNNLTLKTKKSEYGCSYET